MDEETLNRYAAAYQIPPDAIRAWYQALPPEQRSVVARSWKRRRAPGSRDGAGWQEQYRAYEAASASFAALAAEHMQEMFQ